MRRYFIYFSYDGTGYHGWQYQPDAVSVQQKLEEALSLVLRRKTSVVGAGRTDAGVHARMMVAHYETDTEMEVEKVAFKLNCLLPSDIAVYRIIPVSPEAHARFSAISRMYRYYVTLSKSPFYSRYATRLYYTLDFDKMNEAAALLLDYTDFGCFCKAHSDNKTNICHISTARWYRQEEGLYYFEVRADRFLRNMVRAIVGTLLEVGRGKTTLSQFEDIIKSGNRSHAGDSVPAQGLFLEDIVYPQEILLGKSPAE